MKALWLFVHFVGLAFWIGGGISAKMASKAGAAPRVQAEILRKVIAPGAVMVVLSGVVLTLRMMNAFETGMSHWLMAMQGAGLLGALLILVFGLPLAGQIGRLDIDAANPEQIARLRGRYALVASLAGVLAWIALIAGVAYRTGV